LQLFAVDLGGRIDRLLDGVDVQIDTAGRQRCAAAVSGQETIAQNGEQPAPRAGRIFQLMDFALHVQKNLLCKVFGIGGRPRQPVGVPVQFGVVVRDQSADVGGWKVFRHNGFYVEDSENGQIIPPPGRKTPKILPDRPTCRDQGLMCPAGHSVAPIAIFARIEAKIEALAGWLPSVGKNRMNPYRLGNKRRPAGIVPR